MKILDARWIVLVVCVFVMVNLWPSLQRNIIYVALVRQWAATTYRGVSSDYLQDGVPDEWDAMWWGGAMPTFRLVSGETEDFAVEMENAGDQGVVALAQTFDVAPNAHLVCTVSALGEGAAIQFRFHSPQTAEWMARGWLDIAPSKDWQTYRLSLSVPPDVTEARLLLRASQFGRFDGAYVSIEENGQLGPNRLKNSSFEWDGVIEDPLTWWQEHVARDQMTDLPELDSDERLSCLNIADMLSGRYGAVRERARQLADRCALAPDMTSWLIARDLEFERAGGAAARERLYQLAVELAPNCPHPYAALAGFYKSHKAFWLAAEMYHEAATLANETILAGRWYFEEGFLRTRYTGDMKGAIPALQRAERVDGWASGWYAGAAPLNLGIALEATGRFEEAAAAYRRVIACRACQYHHSSARQRLQKLREIQD